MVIKIQTQLLLMLMQGTKLVKAFLKKNWTVIFAVLYLLSPLDFIPDIIPVLGVSDDLIVLLVTLAIKFLDYKNNQDKNTAQTPKGFKNTKILDGEIVE